MGGGGRGGFPFGKRKSRAATFKKPGNHWHLQIPLSGIAGGIADLSIKAEFRFTNKHCEKIPLKKIGQKFVYQKCQTKGGKLREMLNFVRNQGLLKAEYDSGIPLLESGGIH